MYVSEYLKLKRNKTYLYNSIRSAAEGSAKREALQKQYDLICYNIALGEKSKLVKDYLCALKRRGKLRIQLKVWMYYKKDITSLKKTMAELDKSIQDMENFQPAEPTTLKSKPKKSQPKQPRKAEAKVVTPAIEPSYYIINLAGSTKINSLIIDSVCKYINENGRELIEISKDKDDERQEFMYSWKFSVKTLEEQINIQALKNSAEYLLDALKKWDGSAAEIELYGKSQKY